MSYTWAQLTSQCSRKQQRKPGEEEDKNICRLIVVDRLGEERKKGMKKQDDLLPYPYMCYIGATRHRTSMTKKKEKILFSYKTLKSQFFY